MTDQIEASSYSIPRITDPDFLFRTWTGRIIFINSIIFILISFFSKSVMQPPIEVLVNFGAKDPIKLVQGEWWRFITPIFVHIGIIHFFFNTYALKILGPQVEKTLGAKWFLLIYMITGIAGNIFSSLLNIGIGAGASGAIFGIIGAGYIIERFIADYSERFGYNRPKSMYTGLIVINIALGFMIPGIDNAAHIGGLVSGIILAYALFYIQPNRIRRVNKPLGANIMVAVLIVLLIGAYLGTSQKFIRSRILVDANQEREQYFLEKDDEKKLQYGVKSYHLYSRLLELKKDDQEILFQRGSLLLLSGDFKAGLEDLELLNLSIENKQKLIELSHTMRARGHIQIADLLVKSTKLNMK